MSKSKKKVAPFMARQGDVLFIRDESLKSGKEVAAEGGRLVLAIGETSHHAHCVDADKARLYALANADEAIERMIDRVLEVTAKAVVRVESTTSRAHQDERHTPIELPPGRYLVRTMREYSPEMIRSTAD